MKTRTISVPGKLILTGEWFVLQNTNPCIVMALEKFVRASISESDECILYAKNFAEKTRVAFIDNKLYIEHRCEKLEFALCAISVAFEYLTEQDVDVTKNFNLEIDSSEFEIDNQKIGIGSSAAVIVAVLRAMFAFYNCYVDNKIIFKLACFANMLAQDSLGSCADIAAAVYGGVVWYKRFDFVWFSDQLREDLTYSEMIEQEWPGLEIETLSLPQSLKVLISFVGKSANTRFFIQKVTPTLYSDAGITLCEQANDIVCKLREAFDANNIKAVLELIHQNRMLLQKLAAISDVELETKELTYAIEVAHACGGAAKFSGAGGGDCVVAFCSDDVSQQIKVEWEKSGIVLIEVI